MIPKETLNEEFLQTFLKNHESEKKEFFIRYLKCFDLRSKNISLKILLFLAESKKNDIQEILNEIILTYPEIRESLILNLKDSKVSEEMRSIVSIILGSIQILQDNLDFLREIESKNSEVIEKKGAIENDNLTEEGINIYGKN
jgi:hypothetical protein